jgi:hypothetical protein
VAWSATEKETTMKLIRSISMSLALAAAVSPAYADDKKAPPANNDVAKADIDKFLAFFDKIVDVVVQNKDNCDKMAADVNTLIDANADLLQMAADAKAKGKELPKEAKDHMMASAGKMMGAMQKCQTNEKVKAAFMRLDMGGKRKGN